MIKISLSECQIRQYLKGIKLYSISYYTLEGKNFVNVLSTSISDAKRKCYEVYNVPKKCFLTIEEIKEKCIF